MELKIEALETQMERLADGAFLSRIEDVARPALELLTPPERISTTECAARYRYLPDPVGGGASLWSATLTPFINGIQDALDDPDVALVIVPKPGRVGGTVAGENYLFRLMMFGPMPDVGWYLPSDSEVDSYVDRTVGPLFDLHPVLRGKLAPGPSNDKRKFKRVSRRIVEWLQLNRRTITNRSWGFMVGDEIDAANPKLRGTFVDQALIRGTTVPGSKGYLCSHMDAGWTSGIAAAWKESSRGIWYMACPHCDGWASPCPTAADGLRWTLDYERPRDVSDDELLDRVEATAGLKCPHCGRKAADVNKPEMLLTGKWVHDGQSIDVHGRVTGEPKSKRVRGFWIHGTMSPWVSWSDLARRYVAALLVFERTKKSDRLREVTAKVLGEVYEGAGEGGSAVDPVRLRQRAEAAAETMRFSTGTVPDEVLFVTAAVDVGHRKFDVMIVGWDLEGRSWVIERFTIRTRRVGRRDVEIRPVERIEDWAVLEEQVLERELVLLSDPDLRMPIAGIAVDTGDGNVTAKAREFARRMYARGHYWGTKANPWLKVRLIKGSKSAAAPELPVAPREVDKDENGRAIVPPLKEYDLGVHRLKTLTFERLAETEGGPGQVTFAAGLPRSCFEEFGGEVLIDGCWERRGPNESIDCFAYAEAVRQMLQPDRRGIVWEPVERRPVWARPVPISAEAEDEQEQAKPRQSAIERLAALNRR